MSSLPLTIDRAQCAIMFAALASKQSDVRRAAAFLRAGLAEFWSMEEMQKTDKPNTLPVQIIDSKNPLLHLLELARHLNVHVNSVKAQHQSVPVTFEGQEFDLDVYIWSDLDAKALAKLRNGKRYQLAELERLVTWFSTEQLHWGAGDLVRAGVEIFSEELCNHHGL